MRMYNHYQQLFWILPSLDALLEKSKHYSNLLNGHAIIKFNALLNFNVKNLNFIKRFLLNVINHQW